jgi:hypothetical protein
MVLPAMPRPEVRVRALRNAAHVGRWFAPVFFEARVVSSGRRRLIDQGWPRIGHAFHVEQGEQLPRLYATKRVQPGAVDRPPTLNDQPRFAEH